jgi:RNA polymerase sigma-70 factor (ECF subfamily)
MINEELQEENKQSEVSPDDLADIPDEQVVVAVQKGESEKFAVLMRRYERKLLRYTRKFMNDHQDSEDIVQEIFIKAYRNIRSFDAERRFSSWLYRIAHNESINFLKKRKIESIPILDLDVLFPHLAADEKSNEAETFEIKDLVEGSLSKLDAKYREPLVLYYIEGFGYKEIAEILLIPVATVGVRLARAKAWLQRHSTEANNK